VPLAQGSGGPVSTVATCILDGVAELIFNRGELRLAVKAQAKSFAD
jgi:hypothetical protein